MHTDGLEGCLGVLWSGVKRKVGGTGHTRRQGGHCWTRMVKAGCQEEKATAPTGPKRQQKQHPQLNKNAQYSINTFVSLSSKTSKVKSKKKPTARPKQQQQETQQRNGKNRKQLLMLLKHYNKPEKHRGKR